MQDFEKLGSFYLGRRYDLDHKALTDDLVLYDSRDLVTHALCVGMTGSGKTGLCIDVIEEAAIDGIPAIVIDPKGDLTNLLLTFPSLAPAEFEPWVNEDDARRAGQSKTEYAAAQAEAWKKGLAAWGEDGARIQRLRDAADFAIYTPGSSSGIPVSVLKSFDPPPAAIAGDPELLRDRVQTTVSSVLALVGVDADPIKSREHVLMSTIVQAAWQAGESIDLGTLVQRVQQPPMTRVGVIDIESFFPAKDRFAFAMSLNTLLAAPAFQSWLDGDPLDVAAFLRTPSGRPRVSIFSIAHLDDQQRMFFVTLLLNATIGWMRTQPGTSSLRALLYMDEIFGFFPPVANPPSKLPLLTLLKQARAFGLGIVLATQNPVDLDYKGLSNIGTWWLGRLQTERDKARVLDGLEGAAAGASFDRERIDRMLSALGSRVFLMRNVHEDDLEVLQSRWALSYLRGPLGRDEIKQLTAGRQAAAPAPAPAAAVRTTATPVTKAAAAPPGATSPGGQSGTRADRPIVPPDVPQYFAPTIGVAIYEPIVYGSADVRFVDTKLGVDLPRTVTYATSISDGAVPVDWTGAEAIDVPPDTLESQPAASARFGELPAPAARAKNYDLWSKQFITWVAANESLALLRSPSTGELSKPDEDERAFRTRLQQASRERRDAAIDALRKKYAPQQAALDERLRRAQQAKERERQQATSQTLQTVISVGATLVTAFLGRKTITQSTIGRATTAVRGVGRTMKETADVGRAEETVEAVEAQRQQLADSLRAETDRLETSTDAATESLEQVVVKPKRTNVSTKLVALVWRQARVS